MPLEYDKRTIPLEHRAAALTALQIAMVAATGRSFNFR